jgi:hypothetical protein
LGVAFYITSEEHSVAICTEVSGKCLARASEALESLANQLGVSPLSDFCLQSVDEYYSLIGVPEELFDEETGKYDQEAVEQWRREEEGDDYTPVPEGAYESWFAPSEGLVTVRALLAHIVKDPDSIPNAECVIIDLHDGERVLEALQESGIRWHLAVDF